MDELLALKSLVLAEDTAKQEFQQLLSKNITSNNDRNMTISDSLGNTDEFPKPDQTRHTLHENPIIYAVAMPALSSNTTRSVPSEPRMLNKASLNRSDLAIKYSEMWPLLDRLELALKKLETARWQHNRIQYNLQLGPSHDTQLYYQRIESELLLRLKQDLSSFGLSKEKVKHALASLKMYDAGVGLRAEVKHTIFKDDVLLQTLQSLGAPAENDRVSIVSWYITISL